MSEFTGQQEKQRIEKDSSALLISQGAEARLFKIHPSPWCPSADKSSSTSYAVVKQRFSKSYRHPLLDSSLTKNRMISEARVMVRLKRAGIDTPTLYHLHMPTASIYMEWIEGISVKEYIRSGIESIELAQLAHKIGTVLGRMHGIDVIHGDLTTSNMLLRADLGSLVLIDFGLSFTSVGNLVEDKAVDLYVLDRALLSTHPNCEGLFDYIMEGYLSAYPNSENASLGGGPAVMRKYQLVRKRGRKRASEA